MIGIQRFMRSGGKMSETELAGMMRDTFEDLPVAERRGWLREVELSLDGYGGAVQLSAAVRVRDVLKQLEAELNSTPASA